ncbi:MerR family transcriptional regulator [Paraliomyxa miuraensis]|uniref:MerR family transcriptional regulator n=1 Tax=Paraliomyxa miuraensis TaxID=376150 RepID=UPI00225BB572|nr:MerR family transcriptional regulator [Paraliomyxa miuraensis]MCX4246179.1 MerR family transcriptional regulator [Paraliomyxa miuraensis]
MTDDKGKYRINAVAEMTGIPAATLRAWERRYGVPEPRRTESSYRVYSDADIELIRRVRELCDQGMAPSEAAKLVMADIEHRHAPSANSADPYTHAAEAIVHAVQAYDPNQVENAVRHGMALGQASVVFDRVFRPAMIEIGQRWHDGVFSVGQEHMATSIVEAATNSMLRLVAREDADRTVVIACFADDTHTMGSLGFALHMASWDFNVVRLGARTPPHAIRQAVDELDPAIVGLSVTITPAGHRARELVEEYASACRDTPWVVGGHAATQLTELITQHGGTVVEGLDARHMRSTIEALVAKARKRRRPTK